MTALHFQSAVMIAEAIRTGMITAREALELFLARVDKLNGSINAIVVQDRSRAQERAAAADAARARGSLLGPLHGVPMTVKESFQVENMPTTWGIPQLKDNPSTMTAVAVQRLCAAGANIFGKTNVPMGLGDIQSYNDIYGITNNPWRIDRTPGGSSGGSAAALAAGLTGLELGSDIGGSIRNPAHFCGVFGHKSTWNLCPLRGHAPTASMANVDIGVIGPLARSARDLEVVLDVIAGPEEIEAGGSILSLAPLAEPINKLRIAVWSDAGPFCPTSADVGARMQTVADALGRAGAKVLDKARPEFDPAHSHQVFFALLVAAIAARSMSDDEFKKLIARTESQEASATTAVARMQTVRVRDWVRLDEARTQLRWKWRRFFDEVDFLITPIMPVTAFAHDQRPMEHRTIRVDDVELSFSSLIFWAGLAGVAYLPATVFPAGLSKEGLPVGLQIVGPTYADRRTIQLAQRLEQMGFAFQPPPRVE
jgi:amidase